MKKYILIVILLIFSCSKADDCDLLIDNLFIEYQILIVKEKQGNNNPKKIRLLEEERDRKALSICN